ncbi:dihydropteroate synthase [Hyphococcus sp.]|uniref:dihydropteroate synthase n=1 Tax=Hyphococcus sp. TaxID=2038636 RepID=UPI003CCC125E
MGIVNATPDSFSDGGRFLDPENAVAHAMQLVDEGAHILDVGGESTRPGAESVPESEECGRVLPVIENLSAKLTGTQISIDTRKPGVARAAVEAGADIWNDVTALTYSPDSIETAAALECDIVLMHARGDPKTMQDNPYYDDVVEEVYAYLAGRMEACTKAGVDERRLIIDPGIGFGKTLAHNLALLANLDRLCALGRPVLLGASRKRFIGVIDNANGANAGAGERLGGSIAAAICGLQKGVLIFRVHDVAATRQALAVSAAIAGKP